jgi:hypothetical protein
MDYQCLMKPCLKEMPLFRPAMSTKDVMERFQLDSVVRMAANENWYGSEFADTAKGCTWGKEAYAE